MTTDRATSTGTAVTTTAAIPPVRPKTLRVIAGVGMVLLAPVWLLCAMLTLVDAHQGKGVGGPLIDAGFFLLWPAFFLGAFALLLPGGALTPRARTWLVRAQYAVMLLAPVLILLDGDA
ncbi:hypothetical protein H9Y04_28665 [Streptomyces sp. TRM66268-LWL]|uniref:Integral membrane protein n=1 Tax=Streptomyces polyasparticus TaxID=2767826 RepID=A0ABR7SM51_9ACTN|nr:hypothetical protein [Streptomyces polyasparticus]MBC9716512.1 hypothetical protein [Streptomyces polyasparticus]